ncbi:hypothetical protein H257_12772 [Aphanomyces astaci]|uniref:Uncharacterized protein n=1 Tax=Aphanomyces astaci TaxID=112090 RepID=W4FY93_APHAT|nr:hypothetical protein H257_12772 [Aphanomyces astaci]ETV71941.1 hypothetical protein H257_12772 [Aphanomyces astaci]|eukprot:XP_009838384.1 hypothetical protein H257_12772 [Aphanomyces astaci]
MAPSSNVYNQRTNSNRVLVRRVASEPWGLLDWDTRRRWRLKGIMQTEPNLSTRPAAPQKPPSEAKPASLQEKPPTLTRSAALTEDGGVVRGVLDDVYQICVDWPAVTAQE